MPQASYSKYLASRYAGNRRYFKRSHWLKSWKWFLSWCVIGIALAALYFFWNDRSWLNAQTTHGELASVHALWENKCDACHHGFGMEDASFSTVMSPDTRWQKFKCTTCHTAPEHSRLVPDSESRSQSCASCHHDHQGSKNSLVRISDTNCIQCHENLSAHTTQVEPAEKRNPPIANKVTSFTGDHPEFRSISEAGKYERKMNFSHALHMSPGIVYQDAQNNPVKLSELPQEYKDFYKQFSQADGKIQLDCASCHQLDSQRSTMNERKSLGSKLGLEKLAGTNRSDPITGLSFPPRPEGAYFLPIQFSVHCQACHSLQIMHPLASEAPKEILPRMMNIPHHLQPDELGKYLRGVLSADILAVRGTATDQKNRPDSRLDNNKQISQALGQKYQSEVDSNFAKAEKAIYDEPTEESRSKYRLGGSNCMHCHLSAPQRSEEPVHQFSKRPSIIPPGIHTVWNENARFNHVSHRAMSCVDCHKGTMPTGASAPYVEKELLHLPDKQNCIQCHAPLQSSPGSDRLSGGVRHGCTDCHRYHNQDHPLQGLGSPSRDPLDPKLEVQQFLRGVSSKSKDEAKREDKK